MRLVVDWFISFVWTLYILRTIMKMYRDSQSAGIFIPCAVLLGGTIILMAFTLGAGKRPKSRRGRALLLGLGTAPFAAFTWYGIVQFQGHLTVGGMLILLVMVVVLAAIFQIEDRRGRELEALADGSSLPRAAPPR